MGVSDWGGFRMFTTGVRLLPAIDSLFPPPLALLLLQLGDLGGGSPMVGGPMLLCLAGEVVVLFLRRREFSNSRLKLLCLFLDVVADIVCTGARVLCILSRYSSAAWEFTMAMQELFALWRRA